MKKALIALSGGVDSSAAACLTLRAGYEGVGCIMRLHADTEQTETDIEDARRVAERLHIPFHVFDFRARFREQVIGHFCAQYLAGRTPNPCIECNRCFKFGALAEQAAALGCDTIVTGHYARTEETAAGMVLKRAADPAKDQSYVLHMLTQEQLRHIFFPLGTLTKAEARALAEAEGFVTAHKSDSQDICFVPDGDYARVIQSVTGITPKAGDYVDRQGTVLGRHEGLIHYTVGQRRGLGIALGKPAYVVGLDVPENRVIIGTNEDLFQRNCTVQHINWIAGTPPQTPVRCEAKIRYRHTAQPAVLQFHDTQTALLTFDAPQRAMTPGQSAVFYDGDIVLGGGEIISAT